MAAQWLSVAVLVVCVQLTDAVIPTGFAVDGSTNSFRDAKNRTLLFHGTNFVNKQPPYYPTITSDDVALMVDMGFNVVRLGVMMDGLFPTDSTPDKQYIATIKSLIALLWDSGIATIIDLHQDVLSPKICGEGLPDWMMDTETLGSLDFPEPLVFSNTSKANNSAPDGWTPPISCKPEGFLSFIGWSEFYMTDACGKAFNQIYTNRGVLGKMFGVYWQTVSQELRATPGVLAYEIMNEPWLGDVVADPLLLLEGGEAERKAVGPFMQRMYDIIRAQDPATPVLFAPAEFNNRLMRNVGYEAGFLRGEPMAWHIYCVTGTDGDGPTTPIAQLICHFNDDFQVIPRQQDLQRLGTAGFVTEFGAVSAKPTGLEEVRFVANALDTMQPPTSWCFWMALPKETVYQAELARSYAPVVAGLTRTMAFNGTTGDFTLTYTPLPLVAGDAEAATTHVFLSQKYHYPNGYNVAVLPASCCQVKDVGNGITVQAVQLDSTTDIIIVQVTAK